MAKRREFSLRNTIFIRLIATFLMIMVPVVLLGLYVYNWSIRTASEDISKTAVSQISFYLSGLESEIERMKLQQYGMLEDADLNKLAIAWHTMDGIERMDTINAVFNRALSVRNTSRYIRNASVHIRSIGKTISATNMAGVFDEERFQALRTAYGGSASQLIEWNGELHLSASKPSGAKDREPLFIVEIELDRQALEEALRQFNTYPGSGAVLVLHRTGYQLGSGAAGVHTGEPRVWGEQLREIEDGSSATVTLDGERYFVSHAYSEALDVSIYRMIPEQIVRKPLQEIYVWAWLLAAVAVVLIVVYAISTYKFIHQPLLKLVKGFRRLESGDMELAIAHDANDEFRYIYTRFNQMVVNLRMLIDHAYKQKIMAQRAELKQLQSQINPHFLYNSFFILNTMAKTGDTEQIEQFTTQLGEYFQFVTRNASDEVTLKQEIHHARVYADIQEMRFSRRIRVRFGELPEDCEQVRVPRLIVQPLIENAFEHSLEKMAKDGIVDVRFERDEGGISIIVEDNGRSLQGEALARIARTIVREDERAETTGLVNIHRRLVITFGENSGLRVSRGELGGLRATIRLPLGEEDPHV